MKIRELMTTDVQCCAPDASLQQAAQIMADIDVGIVPICSANDRLEGCVTDRDIVIRAVAKGMDVNTTRVGECMSSAMVSCSPEQTAQEASNLMADHQIRRLPVVENGRLVGIVALGDLAVVGIHENEAGFALSEISEPGIH
ncbi:CBS domain-containing protein [Tumebacillus lipolyticus]|uniref:CBS domain-containing protein n=1 Tax=Tumebacillus lipolyticus TaxID=1280370 RepID=A0ABW4ZU99_9BACL